MIKPSGTVTAWHAFTCMGLGLLGGLLLLPPLTCAAPLWSERPATDETIPTLQQLNASLVTLTQKILPTVVSLQVHTKKEADAALPKNHPPIPDDELPSATGSGFIIRADGLVLTNNHVIEESTSIDVRLYDDETTTTTVLGRDPLGDVALLQVATQRSLPVAPLGSSVAANVGELVVAIG